MHYLTQHLRRDAAKVPCEINYLHSARVFKTCVYAHLGCGKMVAMEVDKALERLDQLCQRLLEVALRLKTRGAGDAGEGERLLDIEPMTVFMAEVSPSRDFATVKSASIERLPSSFSCD